MERMVAFRVLALAAIAAAVHANGNVMVHIDVSKTIQTIDQRFLGIGVETWPFVKWQNNFSDPWLRKMMGYLGPSFVRIGGITSQCVHYETSLNATEHKLPSMERGPTLERASLASEQNPALGNFPLHVCNPISGTLAVTPEHIEAIRGFVAETNASLIFDLSELHGRACSNDVCTGTWDTSNVESFLRYLKANNASYVYGLELGNEDAVSPDDQIADYKVLHELMVQVWPEQAERPLLFGPAANTCGATAAFMNATKDFLAGYTYHRYPLNADGGTQRMNELLNASWLEERIIDNYVSECLQAWESVGRQSGMSFLMDETNSDWAAVDGMDTFSNGFWYIASLGQYAQRGIASHCYWTMAGDIVPGFDNGKVWRLVNTTDRTATAGFWITLLHRRWMGQRVLSVAVTGDDVVAYAHCAPTGGGVTVMYAHTGQKSTTISVQLSGTHSTSFKRAELVLNSSSLLALVPDLNGRPLEITKSGDVDWSLLEPRVVSAGSPTFILPPQSYGFVSFPDVMVPICQQSRGTSLWV